MQIGLTVGDSLDRIDHLGEGFDFVELGIGEGELPTEGADPSAIRSRVAAVDCGLCVHLPFSQDLVTPVPEINDAIVSFLDRLIGWAARARAEKAVLHATARDPHDPGLRTRFAEQLRAIGSHAEDAGLELVLENVGHQPRGLPLSVVGELAEETQIPICFDVGHAYMEDGEEAIDRFGRRYGELISHLHVHDARGCGDTHLPLGAGEIEFPTLGDRLREFEGTIAVEVFTDDEPLLRDSAERIGRHLRGHG